MTSSLPFRMRFPIQFESKLFWLVVLGLLLTPIAGCNEKPDVKEEEAEEVVEIAPDPLKMLVVGDSKVGPLIVRQWKARRDGEITIESMSTKDFIETEFAIPQDVDVLMYPPSLLSQLAYMKLIRPVTPDRWNSQDFNKNELLKHFRTSIVRFDNQPWAVPLGGSNFSMLCNKTAFETAESTPPDTWEQVESRLKKLSAKLDEGLEPKIDLPLAEGFAANTYLARLAPAIRHRGQLSTVFDRKSMKPLLTQPEFVQALEQLKNVASSRSIDLTPKDVFKLALDKKSVIAFSWPSELSETGTSYEEVDHLEILPLPGVEKWYDSSKQAWSTRANEDEIHVDLIGFDGLVASIPTNSLSEATAWEFLQWLSGKSISTMTMVESESPGPFRASHLGNVSDWIGSSISIDIADQYADVIANNHRRPLTLMFPRIPKQHEYHQVLDDAVREYFKGDQSAQEVLDSVAKKWDAISGPLGHVKQSNILRKEAGF